MVAAAVWQKDRENSGVVAGECAVCPAATSCVSVPDGAGMCLFVTVQRFMFPMTNRGVVSLVFRAMRGLTSGVVGGVFAVGLLLSVSRPAEAQEVRPGRQRVVELLRRAADRLRPETLASSQTQRENLLERYAELEAYLAREADAKNAEAWLEYIGFEDAIGDSADVKSDAQQVDALREVYWRLARNVAGLERAPVEAFRKQLRRYVTRLTIGEGPAAVRRLSGGLRSIADTLADPSEPLSAEQWGEIGFYLPYLRATAAEPEAVEVLQKQFSLPSVQLWVGSAMIEDLAVRPVDRERPSDECILGTRVLSNTWLRGQLTAQLLPSVAGAELEIQLRGQFESQGTGYQRKVRVYNRGEADVVVLRRMKLTEQGIEAGEVEVDANLETEILGVSHPSPLVRRIATRKAAEQQPRANRIAESRLEEKLASEFREQLDAQLDDGQLLPGSLAADITKRLDIYSPAMQWSSTNERLRIAFSPSNEDQISTDTLPPPVVGDEDFIVQVHESAVQSVSTWVLGRRRLLDTELEGFARGLAPRLDAEAGATETGPEEEGDGISNGGEQSAEAGEGVNSAESTSAREQEPIEIQFANKSPIIFAAQDGGVEIGLYGQFRQRERTVVPLRISAEFRPEYADGRVVRLIRESDVRIVDPLGARSLARTAVKSAVKAKFEEVFPEQVEVEPIDIPVANPNIGVVSRKLILKQLTAKHGWITAAFDLETTRETPVTAQPSESAN